MTDKNWLIRTKNNHILGPVSKAKIQELISAKSIKGDDEICSGNGYWFYVRENELVEKYIHNDNKQGFNPVQEAGTSEQSVIDELKAKANSNVDFDDEESGPVGLELDSIPLNDQAPINSEDHHDEQQVIQDITLVQTNLSDILSPDDTASSAEERTEEKNVEILEEIPEVPKRKRFEAEAGVKAGGHRKLNGGQKLPSKKSNISATFLYIMALLFLLMAIAAFYFRKQLIQEINAVSDFSMIPSAHAQVVDNTKKKSGFRYLI